MGRSYGDSAPSEQVIFTHSYNHFIDFDSKNGLLRVQAGTTLKEMLDVIVPKGWFLPVTPARSSLHLAAQSLPTFTAKIITRKAHFAIM
jgi:FAD/FMN-containing dehydrogenase